MARRLALISALVSAAAAADTDVCMAVPRQTLTFDCGGLCGRTASCLRQDANSTRSLCVDTTKDTVCHVAPSGACRVACFERSEKASASVFKFYVAFNSSPDSAAANQTDAALVESTTDDVPYASNALVRRIGELALPNNITTVTIAGGRSEAGTRGFVVDVDVDPKIFRSAPHVISVSLVNMNLSNTVDTAALVPRTLKSLDLHNTNLDRLPPSINSLTQLEILVLDINKISQFQLALNLPSLQTLRLSGNALMHFEASVPSLQILDLSDNLLAQFPYDVLSLPKLKSLRLAKNPKMKGVALSASHYSKISTLEQFTIDVEALDNSNCLFTQLKPLARLGASVCVLSDTEWKTYTGRSSVPTSKDRHTTVIIVVSVLAALVGVVMAVGAYWCWIKKNEKLLARAKSTHSRMTDTASGDFEQMEDEASPSIQQVQTSHLQDDIVTSHPRYSINKDADLLSHRINHALLEDVQVISAGGFAVVWLVKYTPQNRLLASKRLIVHAQTTREKKLDFVVEIKLNMQLVHPSIVEFVGVAWTMETDLQALFEYMPNGDLRSYLTKDEDPSHSVWGFDKLRITIDIIEALVYVHSFSPPLVHRDLKSRNVLLADDMKAKLCDFGVSRFASENSTMTAGVGTGKWLAPEVIAGSKDYDESSDIYAFGVILSELDTHELPYEDAVSSDGDQLAEVAVLRMVASGQLQPTFRASCPEPIRQLALQCLAFDPLDRPTAIGVAYALRRLRNDWYKQKKMFRTE